MGKSLTLASTIDAVVAPRYGIFRRIVERNGEPDVRGLFVAGSQTTSSAYFRDPDGDAEPGTFCSGAGVTRSEALWAAIGEGLERYSAGLQLDGDLIWGAPNNLPLPAVDPRAFIAFSDEQYAQPGTPYRRQKCDTPRNWVTGWNLADGGSVLLPAQQVFLGYHLRSYDEAIRQTVSTGVAVGPTWDWALAGAIMEVIERDAFMTYWLRHTHGPGPYERK